MKTLYLDCSMGAAGDMLSAALLELVPEREAFLEKLNAVSIPGVEFIAEKTEKCGIRGTRLKVLIQGVCEGADEAYIHAHEQREAHIHAHEQEEAHGHSLQHRTPAEIREIISALSVPEKVRADVLSVYGLLADAESHVHGVPVNEIHFHEVGTMDAIADITAFCMLIRELEPETILASVVHTGYGQVRCAHGVLPVPAPAAAYILQGIPIVSGSVEGELCTPTGAALLKHFVSSFETMPVMTVSGIGYGMGQKDFAQANCIRAFLGETEDHTDRITELSFNVDDMTAEEIGFAVDALYEAGAREVFTIPAGMKKSRPGVLVTVITDDEKKQAVIRTIFRHTSTIGIRESGKNRYVLERRTEEVTTPCGVIRKKISAGYGVTKEKYEYDDLAKAAAANGVSLDEVRKAAARSDGMPGSDDPADQGNHSDCGE